MPRTLRLPCRPLWSALPLIGFLGGCTLYEPLLPTLPAVRQSGDYAGGVSWQVPYGGQVSAVWSPVAHGLVFASGAAHFYNVARDSSNNFTRGRQYEVGAGGYTTLGRAWLSASGGVGQGRGYRYGKFKPFDLFGGGIGVPVPGGSPGPRQPIPESLGHYNTRFAQVAAWWPSARSTGRDWGANLRLSQVDFTDLTRNGQAQPLPTQQSLQTAIAVQQQWRWVSWQLAASYTIALGEVTNESAFVRAPLRLHVGAVFYPFRKNRAGTEQAR